MNRTAIEWTDFTANPVKFRDAAGKVVWGCVHASTGCLHCYAETLAHRYGKGGPFNVPTMKGLTPFLDTDEGYKMRTYKPASGKRCFIGDMTDLFGEWVSDDLLNDLFSNILEHRTDVTWQILTKRADRMQRYLSWRWGGRIPSRHIWLGVSVENQNALGRVDALKDTPAAVRFVSFEPLLEDMGAVLLDGIDWAILGGESGPKSRPCDVQWIRSLVRQCEAQGVAAFVKQLGSRPTQPVIYGPLDFSGEQPIHHEPMRLTSRKGSDVGEWPDDLVFARAFPLEAGRHG